jgi:hypothetical protein
VYRFVKPEIVVEIVCSDVQSEDAKGDPILKMALQCENTEWHALRPVPSISLLHPVLERIRDDKKADSLDVRLTQLDEYCSIGGLNEKVEKVELPASSILRREVFVKKSKGKQAVRKLLVIKTNKEKETHFPPFVVHFTDYSPNRKNPLDQDVLLFESKKEANQAADNWKEEEIGRGWELAK